MVSSWECKNEAIAYCLDAKGNWALYLSLWWFWGWVFSDLDIFGYFYSDSDIKHLKIKSLLPPSEKNLIINFISLLFRSPLLQGSFEDCSKLPLKIHVSQAI